MQKIEKQQIFQVITGLLATIGFFWLIDYPITSSVLIVNFIILLLSPTQQMAKTHARGQLLAQVIGISLGIVLALLITNSYAAVFLILILVLTLPIWLKVKVPTLPLAIAAYIIFQSETVNEASVERIILKVMSISIALFVAWLFAQRHSSEKAKAKIYHQFLQLSQRIHELIWRSLEEKQALVLPQSVVLSDVTLQSVDEPERIFIVLNQTLKQIEQELRVSQQEIPLPARQELLYALRIHHDYVQQYQAVTLTRTCFPYEVPDTSVISTLAGSKLLTLVTMYSQQLQSVSQTIPISK
ncbi:MAG: hypothetical protein ACRC5Q_06525 [Culicoidibacterales bacterium]